MRRLIALVMLVSAFSLSGCATTGPPAPKAADVQPLTAGQSAKPLIRCSTCGVEFTTIKDVQKHMIDFPAHKLEPMQDN